MVRKIDGEFAEKDVNVTNTALPLPTGAATDDVNYVDDADWTATTSKHTLVGGVYQSTPGTITDGDTGPFRVDINGHLIANNHAESISLVDNASNTQSILVDESGNFIPNAAFGYNYDGATWDRIRGDATNGLLVNLGTNNDTVVSGTDAEDAAVTANPVLVGGRYDTTDRVLEDGDAGAVAVDVAGNSKVVEQHIGLDGTGTQAVTDLPSANTFVTIPSTAPTAAYQLRLQFRGTGDFYLTFENGGTAGTSGIKYADEDIVDFVMGPSDVVYVATKTAGDDVNWIAKEVV
jgi:hypothetical protein